MFNDFYQHDAIRKYHAYFASLFSNIVIERSLEDGTKTAKIKVPLHYASAEHALTRVTEDETANRADAIVLPAMAFDMIDMQPGMKRHVPTMNRIAVEDPTNTNNFKVVASPVPYDFHFRLAIMVKNVDDGLKIIEQIIPYFAPDFTAQLDLLPEMGITQVNTPLVLRSVTPENNVPANYKERIERIWYLDFTLQGMLFGPEKKFPIIKFVNTTYYTTGVSNTLGDPFLSITTQPGLTANGEPTSNVAETIPYSSISVHSNFGYVVQSNTYI